MSVKQTASSDRRAFPLHALIPLSMAAAGLGLLGYMVTVEGELGAIPLLLIVVGIGWFVAAPFLGWRE